MVTTSDRLTSGLRRRTNKANGMNGTNCHAKSDETKTSVFHRFLNLVPGMVRNRAEYDSDSSATPLVADDACVDVYSNNKMRRRQSSGLSPPCCYLLIVFLTSLICFLLMLVVYFVLPPKPCQPPSESCIGQEKEYRFATVSADARVCSTVGTDFLAKYQGSAVDSAIAILLCLGLANAHSMGIGGGFFATIYIKENKTTYALDARDVAPLRANKTMFVNNSEASSEGGLAMTVPTEIAGYKALHDRFGKLPWKKLFEPTIKFCFDGFPLETGLYNVLVKKKDEVMNTPGLRKMFVNPTTGELYNVGDKIKNPELGRTLRTISENKDAFYSGPLAEDIIKDIEDAGGIITIDDFKTYSVKWHEPVKFNLRGGLTLHSLPPPSSGAVVGFIMKVLDGYKFPVDAITKKDPVLTYHRIVEAWKFAYAKRYELGDMDFTNVTQPFQDLLSAAFAEATRAKITDDRTHPPEYYGHYDPVPDGGTSHLNVLAANGDAVAVTSTINSYFGCGVVGNKTGIIFNDGMDDFSTPNKSNQFNLPPSPTNFIEPGKRPMSSMAPTILTDDVTGDVRLAVGASGGSKIISGTSYVALRVLFFNETLKEATDAERLYHQWIPNKIVCGWDFDKTLIRGLEAKGHKVEKLGENERGSIVQSLETKKGVVHSYSDPRKGGCPDGY